MLLIAIVGGLVWFQIISDSESWPQQAAKMVGLVAFIAIPYIIARVLSNLRKLSK